MIVTTTTTIEGKDILSYQGIVFGEVISGIDFIRDFAVSLRDMFGGRSATYEEEITNARQTALKEMEQRAEALGANAVVGVSLDYEVLGANNGMLMVTATGTAVVVR